MQPGYGDFGLAIKVALNSSNSSETIRSIRNMHLTDVSITQRPIREVFAALNKITGEKKWEMELNFVQVEGSRHAQRRIQRKLFLRLTQDWFDWWSQNWQRYVSKTDAQLEKTHDAIQTLLDTQLPRKR